MPESFAAVGVDRQATRKFPQHRLASHDGGLGSRIRYHFVSIYEGGCLQNSCAVLK
jgi:hypothetical protein